MNPGMWSWRPPQHQPHHKTARGKREGSKGSQTTREQTPKRGLQKIQGLSVQPLSWGPAQLLLPPQPWSGWLQLIFCPTSSLESAQGHTWECLAASPWLPRPTHTDPTPAPAPWDLSQVFWRKSKLSQCDGLFCSGFAHLQKLLFCWGFFLAFAASIPSSALPSASRTWSNNPPNLTRSRAVLPPHHQLQGSRQLTKTGLRDNSASQGCLEKGG